MYLFILSVNQFERLDKAFIKALALLRYIA